MKTNEELSKRISRIFAGTTIELEKIKTERIRRSFYLAGIVCFVTVSIATPIHLIHLYLW